jgi:hypothetical protein
MQFLLRYLDVNLVNMYAFLCAFLFEISRKISRVRFKTTQDDGRPIQLTGVFPPY